MHSLFHLSRGFVYNDSNPSSTDTQAEFDAVYSRFAASQPILPCANNYCDLQGSILHDTCHKGEAPPEKWTASCRADRRGERARATDWKRDCQSQVRNRTRLSCISSKTCVKTCGKRLGSILVADRTSEWWMVMVSLQSHSTVTMQTFQPTPHTSSSHRVNSQFHTQTPKSSQSGGYSKSLTSFPPPLRGWIICQHGSSV